MLNGANPLVSMVNGYQVVFNEKDVYNNSKTSLVDKTLAGIDALVSFFGFGNLGTMTVAGKEVSKELVLEGGNVVLQSADELGAFDELKKKL